MGLSDRIEGLIVEVRSVADGYHLPASYRRLHGRSYSLIRTCNYPEDILVDVVMYAACRTQEIDGTRLPRSPYMVLLKCV